MASHLTERFVKAAEIGTRKYVVFDEDCAGFGLCVFLSGRKGFILIYRAAGRQRRMTIGTWPSWSVTAARDEAKRLKRDIDRGEDPMDTRTNARHAPIMKDLIDRFIDEHLPKLEATNAKDQISMLNGLVLPDWRTRKVVDITPTDIDRLLTKIALGRPRPSKTAPKTKRRAALKPAKPTPGRRSGITIRSFSCALKCKLQKVECLTLVGTEGADRAPVPGRSCWRGGREVGRSLAGYRLDCARKRSRHVPRC